MNKTRSQKREFVYEVIDNERDYQDSKWGGEDHDSAHTVHSFIIFMQHYLNQAVSKATTEFTDEAALNELRKVVALGVACFEAKGIPQRK